MRTRAGPQASHPSAGLAPLRTYDRLSRWYDWLATSERPLIRAGLALLAARPGERVLEIGVGAGRALAELAKAVGADGRVVGLDLSSGMLAQARRRTTAGATLVCGDARAQPFNAGAFDAIFMSFTLELFAAPEMLVVLSECRRVLRNGGRIGVVSLSRQRGATPIVRAYEWAHRRLPAVIDCRPILLAQTLAAGFVAQTSITKSLWGLPVELVVATRSGSLRFVVPDDDPL